MIFFALVISIFSSQADASALKADSRKAQRACAELGKRLDAARTADQGEAIARELLGCWSRAGGVTSPSSLLRNHLERNTVLRANGGGASLLALFIQPLTTSELPRTPSELDGYIRHAEARLAVRGADIASSSDRLAAAQAKVETLRGLRGLMDMERP